jgi:hypothetical protein
MLTPQQRTQLAEYLQHFCPEGWREVHDGRRATALPRLTSVDKAAIYYYSDDGYEFLNEKLHASGGDNTTLFGQGLAAALAKLPVYKGAAYCSAYLSAAQLRHYRACAQDETPVKWPAFLSASQEIGSARVFLASSEKNCLFDITSRTGRCIEEISKHGIDSQNEHEVLFVPNTWFRVLEVADETGYTSIVLDEL